MTSPKTSTREAAALEAQIRDAENAIAALLKNLRPGCPPAQRVSIERMVAKKQTTLRRLQNRRLGLAREANGTAGRVAEEIPGPRTGGD